MTSIFLSYARDDDEAFVKRLYHELTVHGHDVWWDRVSMPSRALTFFQEIRDAINERERMVLVVGPAAVVSEYVRAEWQYALLACKAVTPVLRLGDYSLLPPELSRLHCPDMRESRPFDVALAELLRVLSQPVPVLAELRGVPSLPPHFVAPPDDLRPLRDAVLADIRRPTVITSARRTSALLGMGGVGKSVLAAAFARECETRRAFRDGVVWLAVGQEPDLTKLVRLVGLAFGGRPHDFLNPAAGAARLGEVLEDKNCLIALDDVWDVGHVELLLNSLGPRCRLLVTTREGQLATSLGAQECPIDVLSDEAALQLLADWSAHDVVDLPHEARGVASECGNLPYALALCGAMVHDGAPWADLLEALRDADLEFLSHKFPNYPYLDILKALKVSIDKLREADPRWAECYEELAIFAPDEGVPEAVLVCLWSHAHGLDDRDCRQVIAVLARKSLLRTEGTAPRRRIWLHDLQHDYLRATLGSLSQLHARLLAAYHERCSQGWHTGPNDGYFFQRVSRHLLGAGRHTELYALLTSFDWLRAKLEASGPAALIEDYDLALANGVTHPQGEQCEPGTLYWLRRAIELSAPILAEDTAQLPAQLLSRLATREDPDIAALLERAKRASEGAWLCPLNPALAQPQGPLLWTRRAHQRTILALAVTPDGKHAISASADTTLKVWELSRAEEVHTLSGHAGYVHTVAVTQDGGYAVSGSEDGTVRVWSLQTGTEVRVFREHKHPVRAVAIVPGVDETLVVSGDVGGTIHVWHLGSGTVANTVRTAKAVYAVAVTPDGEHVLSDWADGTLRAWQIRTGAAQMVLADREGQADYERAVTVLAMAADGKHLVAAQMGALTVWDLRQGSIACRFEHGSHVDAVAPIPGIVGFVSVSDYNSIKVWGVGDRAAALTLPTDIGVRTVAAVPPDGRRLVTGSNDGSLKVWDLAAGCKSLTSDNHAFRIMAATVTPDGSRGISAEYDGTLRVWDMATGAQLHALCGHAAHVYDVAPTPDGRCVVSASEDLTLRMWSLETGSELLTLRGHVAPVHAVAVTSDGRYIVSASYDGTVKVWDPSTGATLRSFPCRRGDNFQRLIAISGARCLLSVSNDDRLKVLSTASRIELHEFAGGHSGPHTPSVLALSVSADGERAISYSYNGTKIWDLKPCTELLTLRTRVEDSIRSVALAPRHALLAWESGDLEVWNLCATPVARVLRRHSGPISTVAITPDGRYAVSASFDHTLRLWDLHSHAECLVDTYTGESPFRVCAVAGDGLGIIAGDEAGKAHILRLGRGA